jgi:DNA-binding GntR family transcriptional regulator
MSTINAEDSVAGSHISTIRVGSVRDHVRRALEAAMVAGELKPGQMYSAPALSERFGVSATPVREAMLDLVKDGFVVAVRNRGFLVLEMSDEDLDEISQIRLLLEVPTTAQLAKLITTNVLDHLRTIADEIVAAAERGDLIDYLDSDRRFHVELVDRLRRQTRLFGLDDLVAAGRLVASAREHHALLDAMQARDTSLTRSVITSHIKHTRGLWVGRAEE